MTARAACRNVTIDFLLLETNSMTAAIKDDIRSDLAVIGIDIVSRVVDYETFIADMVAGNYDMVFSETWGAPYDPHSFVASWTTPDEAHYSALPTAGIDTTQFAADVADILSESEAEARQEGFVVLAGVDPGLPRLIEEADLDRVPMPERAELLEGFDLLEGSGL